MLQELTKRPREINVFNHWTNASIHVCDKLFFSLVAWICSLEQGWFFLKEFKVFLDNPNLNYHLNKFSTWTWHPRKLKPVFVPICRLPVVIKGSFPGLSTLTQDHEGCRYVLINCTIFFLTIFSRNNENWNYCSWKV